MTAPMQVIRSTADLTPAGLLGYAKAYAALATGILVVLVPFFPIDSTVARWIQGALAVCGVIAVFAIPNPVQPVLVKTEPDPVA
jgi:hypothetical protein